VVNSIYASREMSYFLIGKSKWWEDEVRSDLKAPGFLRFSVDALLLYDTIELDPSVGQSQTLFDNISDYPAPFCELVEQNAVCLASITRAQQDSLRDETLQDLGKCLKLLPSELLGQWERRFAYHYLLESPWWLFVREVDLVTADTIRETSAGGKVSRGLVPFLYSTLWSLKASHALRKPSLVSQIEFTLRDELLEVGLNRSLRHNFETLAHVTFRDMIRDASTRLELSIPSFYDICAANAKSPLDVLANAVRLRNDPDCRWFRKHFWGIVNRPNIQQQWRSEIASVTDRLLRRTKGRFWANLRQISLAIRHCGPVCYLLGVDSLNEMVKQLGHFLVSSAAESRNRRELGPLYFLLRNHNTPPTAISDHPPQSGIAADEAASSYWNSLEKATLARFVLPTSPAVEHLIDKVREVANSGVFRMSATTLSERLYAQLAKQEIHYDYEPYSPEIPQRIRLPRAVLHDRPGPRVATCLDLTLLLAAGIEAGHAHPLIVHLVHRSGDAHVLCGFWVESPLDDIVELSAGSVRRWLENQSIRVFESTGVCTDEEFACSFTEAEQRALQCLSDASWTLNFTINLFAARRHGILGMPESAEKTR
jgi:hypothetical protein